MSAKSKMFMTFCALLWMIWSMASPIIVIEALPSRRGGGGSSKLSSTSLSSSSSSSRKKAKTRRKSKETKRTTTETTSLEEEEEEDGDTFFSWKRFHKNIAEVDLSYLHNIPPEKLAQVVQDQRSAFLSGVVLDSDDEDNDGNHSTPILVMDWSHSALGDAGFRKLLNALLPTEAAPSPATHISSSSNKAQPPSKSASQQQQVEENDEVETTTNTIVTSQEGEDDLVKKDTTTSNEQPDATSTRLFPVHLACRMNDLTPVSAKSLLHRIIIQMGISTPLLLQSAANLYMASLDLGWNLLFTDDLSGHDNFHDLLEQVIAATGAQSSPAPKSAVGEETLASTRTKTPQQQPQRAALTHLALEHCGLGPATCRALAKGLLARHGLDLEQNDTSPKKAKKTKKGKTKKPKQPPATTAAATTTTKSISVPSLSLNLAGNPWIGDAGTAALAAALRRLVLHHHHHHQQQPPSNNQDESSSDNDDVANSNSDKEPCMVIVLDTLDLSDCGIGDTGAQALALALEEQSSTMIAVRRLILSHNQITEEGATALGRALILSSSSTSSSSSSSLSCSPHCLDLSHNPIGDRGAAALAAVWQQGHLSQLVLRSCQIFADGAAAFGKALSILVDQTTKLPSPAFLARQEHQQQPSSISFGAAQRLLYNLDLSGNPLGRKRGKSKSSDGSKYSASRLKSTATATAASYMNMLKQGLQDFGGGSTVSSSASGSGGGDSDDEEGGGAIDGKKNGASGDSKEPKRCGIRALVNAFLAQNNANANQKGGKTKDATVSSTTTPLETQFHIGLRHCFLDHGAADALAALLVEFDDRKTHITLDVALNTVLEEDMVAALRSSNKNKATRDKMNDDFEPLRLEMAERYMDLWNAILESKQRAAQARERARAQVRAESVDRWDTSPFLDKNNDEEELEEDDNGENYRAAAGARKKRKTRRERPTYDDEEDDVDDEEDYDE